MEAPSSPRSFPRHFHVERRCPRPAAPAGRRGASPCPTERRSLDVPRILLRSTRRAERGRLPMPSAESPSRLFPDTSPRWPLPGRAADSNRRRSGSSATLRFRTTVNVVPFPTCGFHLKVAAHERDDVLDDGHPQAGASRSRTPFHGERLEHVLAERRLHADAVVGHHERARCGRLTTVLRPHRSPRTGHARLRACISPRSTAGSPTAGAGGRHRP